MQVAVTFPGQGSQRPGMGVAWRDSPGWALVDRGAAETGYDLAELLTEADAEVLRTPWAAQLSTFLLSLVIWESVRPVLAGHDVVAMAGHSLGEYTALAAAGALSPGSGLALVAERAEAMQAASETHPGSMVAVLGLTPDEVQESVAQVAGAWVANRNAPGNVVVSGTPQGLVEATERVLAAGARRVLPLPVGGAFHSPLMQPAADRLAAALARAPWQAGAPVVSNVDAAPHVSGWPQRLGRQLLDPVRWTDVVDTLAGAGAEILLEVGPGGVLTGLAKRCAPQLAAVAVAAPADLAKLAALLDSR